MDKKSEYQDQIDKISKQIVKEPANAELYQKRADLFFEKEQIENALSDYNKILEINPKDSDAFYKRALCFLDQKKIHKSLEDLVLALKCNPKNIGALLLSSTFLVASKNVDDAIYNLEKVLEIDSNNNEAKEELGKIYCEKKEYDKALEYFKDILKTNPETIDDLKIDSLKKIVEIYHKRNDNKAAIKYFNKVKDFTFVEDSKGVWVEHKVFDEDFTELVVDIAEYYELNDQFDIAKEIILDIPEIEFSLSQGYPQSEKIDLINEKESKRKIAKIQKESKEKLEKVIQQYSHTLANTLFPNTIYEVANKLKKHIEFKKDARVLSDAYHAEVLIKRQGRLLQARNTGSEKSFQMLIRGDRLEKDSQEKHIIIQEILNNSVERVLVRFLNQDYHKIDKMRDQLVKKQDITLDDLKNSYEEKVFFNSKMSAIDWTNKYLIKVDFTMSSLWKQIRLQKDNYAEALIQGYFQELLFNALKYRDQSKTQWVKINFSEKKISNKNYLFSVWENSYVKGENISISTHKGLEGIKNDLEMLNETKDSKKTMVWEEKDSCFKVSLFFKKDLLLLPPKKVVNFDKLFNEE